MTWAMFSGLYRPFTARRSGRLGTTVDALSNVSVDDQPARPVKQFGDVNLNMSHASIFIYIPGIRYKYNIYIYYIPGIYYIYIIPGIYIPGKRFIAAPCNRRWLINRNLSAF